MRWRRLFNQDSRVTVLREAKGEAFRVRTQRHVIVLIFLAVWLVFWSQAGLPALRFEMAFPGVFMTLWLVGWAWGMMIAPMGLAWMLWGSETLAVVDRDLHVHKRIWPWSRRRVYEGRRIHALRLSKVSSRGIVSDGPLDENDEATIAFLYGGKTRVLWTSLPAAEAKPIVTALASRLPAGVTDPD